MIAANSRYASNTVVLLPTSRGSVVTIAAKTPTAVQIQYTWMVLHEGERLDHLAKMAFGDETLWWKIADVNPEILDWTNVPVGTRLRVPRA